MKRCTLRVSTLLCAVLCAQSAWATIEVSPDPPVVGAPLTLTVHGADGPVANTPVQTAYMPGSQVEWTEEQGTTDASGRLTWTPERFGLARITVGEESRVVSIRAASPPIGAVVVFLVAAGLLSTLTVLGFRGIFAAGGHLATSGGGPDTRSSEP